MYNNICVKWYKETATLKNGNEDKKVTIELIESENIEEYIWQVSFNEKEETKSTKYFDTLKEAYEYGSKMLS